MGGFTRTILTTAMRTRHHMRVSIEGMIKYFKRRKMDGLMTTDEGIPVSDSQARAYLKECHEKGWKVIPTVKDSECPNFDHFGGGCPGHVIEEVFDERELHIAAHMVGINLYGAIKSTKKKDKKLPKEFYRNGFTSFEEGKDWKHLNSMVDKGLAEQLERTASETLVLFRLTEQGLQQFRKQFKQAVHEQVH